MFSLIKKAQRQRQWVAEVLEKRKADEERYAKDKVSLPPPFNKQHFSVQGQGGVVITGNALKVMTKNVENIHNLNFQLTRSEIVSMKSVVEGLAMIHHGETYIKEILSHVVSLECYEPLRYVDKKSNAEETYCYYLITGTAEVTYDGRHGQSLQIFKTDVIYTHSTGEYMGLISSVSPDKDVAPPATIYTTEVCEFLKINRTMFHERLRRLREVMDIEKLRFMSEGTSMLSQLSTYLQESLVKFMVKEKHEANTVILQQGELSEYVCFLAEGRCTCLKKVYLPQVQREIILTIGQVEMGEFVGEERVTHDQPNYCNIVTKSPVVCFKVHRGAFEARGSLRNELMKLMKKQKHQFASTQMLRVIGLELFKWEMYKRMEAKIDKDIHEDRQMILHCDNLRFSKGNQLCDFMAGQRLEKKTPEDIQAENLLHHNRPISDMYSSMVNLASDSALPYITEGNEDHPDVFRSLDVEDEITTDDEDVKSQAGSHSSSKKTPRVDARQVLRMFKNPSGNMTLAASMTSQSFHTLPLHERDSESEDEQCNYVTTESDEILQRAKQAAVLYRMKIMQKRRRPATVCEESKTLFETEYDKAKTQLVVCKMRSSMLAKKLRRNKRQHDKDYRRMKSESLNVNKETTKELSLDFELERREGKDTVPDLNSGKKKSSSQLPVLDEPDYNPRKSVNSASIGQRRERFMRRLSVRLSEGESFLPPGARIQSSKYKVKQKNENSNDVFMHTKDRSGSFTGMELTCKTPKPEVPSRNKLLLRRRSMSVL